MIELTDFLVQPLADSGQFWGYAAIGTSLGIAPQDYPAWTLEKCVERLQKAPARLVLLAEWGE